MNETIEAWLEQGSASAGVIACAVRRPDRTIAVKSCHPEIPEPGLVEVIQNLAETIHVLQQNRVEPQFLCWTFESSQFRCAVRDDGAIAVVLAGRELNVVSAADQMLWQFLQEAR